MGLEHKWDLEIIVSSPFTWYQMGDRYDGIRIRHIRGLDTYQQLVLKGKGTFQKTSPN